MASDKQLKKKGVGKVKRFRYWLLYKMRLISGRKYAEKLEKWGLPCGKEIEKHGAKMGLGERIRYVLEYPIRLQADCDRLEAEIERLKKDLP